MTESNVETDKEALSAWYKSVLDAVVKDMIKIGAVTGAAVEASPVWAMPYEILIAKVWGAAQKSQFIWTISGNSVFTDHIAGSMAATPKDVARHFALKWQLNADQLLAQAKNTPTDEGKEVDTELYSKQLIQYAESLYGLTDRDDIWKEVP